MHPREACNSPHTPTSCSAGAERLVAEKDGWEGRAGTDTAKMGEQVGPGACKQELWGEFMTSGKFAPVDNECRNPWTE